MLAVAPDTLEHVREFCARHLMPFPCLADPTRAVFKQYDVQSRLWSLGQQPGLYIIDRQGIVRAAYLGSQQWEIPSVEWVLGVLDEIEERRSGRGGEQS